MQGFVNSGASDALLGALGLERGAAHYWHSEGLGPLGCQPLIGKLPLFFRSHTALLTKTLIMLRMGRRCVNI